MNSLVIAVCWLLAGQSFSHLGVPQEVCVSEVSRSAEGEKPVELSLNGKLQSFSVDRRSLWNDGEITLFSSAPAEDETPKPISWSVVASLKGNQITSVRLEYSEETVHGPTGITQAYEKTPHLKELP